MKKFVYIVTDRNRNFLHVGLCTDLLKTLDFFRDVPHLFFDSSQQLSRLVYFEETDDERASARFSAVSRFTRMQKERMIRSHNPDWTDLTNKVHSEGRYAMNQDSISFTPGLPLMTDRLKPILRG